jgi:predicted RNase H-like HicB family nuclease
MDSAEKSLDLALAWRRFCRFVLCHSNRGALNSTTEMKSLQHTIQAIVRRGEESGYVAECVEIAVVTQGETLDPAIRNLQEAVALHLEGEDLPALRNS